MSTMQAAVWHGRQDVRLETVPRPAAPAAGWVTVRVHWCGICGSDLHEYVAGPVFSPMPIFSSGHPAWASSSEASARRHPMATAAW